MYFRSLLRPEMPFEIVGQTFYQHAEKNIKVVGVGFFLSLFCCCFGVFVLVFALFRFVWPVLVCNAQCHVLIDIMNLHPTKPVRTTFNSYQFALL